MNEKLDSWAGVLSDRGDLDWNELLGGADSDQERRWIDNLRVISEVSRLARGGKVVDGGDGSAQDALAVGPKEQWGPLRLLEKIGAGGFGEVYRAWDSVLHRQVALKLLRGDLATRADWQEKALAEGRLLAKVDHRGVAHVYGVENHEGRVGIWMEFVAGSDLGSLLAERGRMTPVEVASIGVDLCDALGAIHAANVVHKDIKPSNVMRDGDGRVVITDFGAGRLRKIQLGESERLLVGTPLAMAPELFRGEPATPQSDIYSLGVLLYQLLSGATPVEGTAREIAAAHEAGRRRPLGQARPGLPDPLVATVERALAPERAARFPSTAQMREALQAFLDQPAPVAKRRPWWGVAVAAAAAIAVLVIVLRAVLPGGLNAEATFTSVHQGQRVVLTARGEISPADQLMIALKINRSAYVYVLNLDRTGRGTLMFPMRGGGLQNPLPGGTEHLLPGEVDGEPFAWTFDATVGLERFLVVASHERLVEFERELNQLATVDVGGGVRYAVLGEPALGTLLRGVSGAAPLPATAAAADPGQQLLDMARRQATTRGDGSGVWLYEMELYNSGR